MKRKIAIVTGTRAEYSYLKPLIKCMEHDKKINLILYVTGMHLLKEYGNTINDIKKDGFKIKKTIDMGLKTNNSDYDLSISIGNGILGFTKALNEDKPDIVVVFGDRIEPFAVAVACVAMGIPIAHINGGDVGLGDIDNSLRHAITKLSNIHFPATKKSEERILRLGEEKWRVSMVGSLSLDTILNMKISSKNELFNKYNISNKKIILIVYHPITTEQKDAKSQINLILKSVTIVAKKRDMNIVIIYPNAYPGGYEIIKVLKEYKQENVYVFKNMPHKDYISLMAVSSVMVGNSSSGIIEAPSLGIPYICTGTRQQGREKAINVIDVDYNQKIIIKETEKAIDDDKFLTEIQLCKNPFGNGNASEMIKEKLIKIKINKKLLEKRITY